MKPSLSDHAKAQSIRLMRRSHRRTLESTSTRTYRRRAMPTSDAPRLAPAARVYKGMGWLPTGLKAPVRLPREAKLPNSYYLPYYATSKVGWLLYGRNQIGEDLAWSEDLPWNDFFPGPPEGWSKFDEPGAADDDQKFVALRLQGPNPFMLRAVAPGSTTYTLDFGPLFEGIFVPTEARFELTDGVLAPTGVRLGGTEVTPTSPQWSNAKRIVDALDARYSVFIRHLLNVHLMVGQAYSLAAYSLPTWHPLRPFMHFFTYGTLVVNDAAYKALLQPDSYFLRSNFVSAGDAQRLIENSMRAFDFTEWIWPLDRDTRGLGAIAGHPYVEEADEIWAAFEAMVDEHLTRIGFPDDDDGDRAVRRDADLVSWFRTFCDVLPGDERVTLARIRGVEPEALDREDLPRLESRRELALVMTALLWNNVVHEVCGNLTPLLRTKNPDDRRGVSFDHLRALADHAMGADVALPEPRAADVFLMDQATYVSSFNVAGNNLIRTIGDRFIDDPRLQESLGRLQRDLEAIEQAATARNARRAIPFENMLPSKFEASISF